MDFYVLKVDYRIGFCVLSVRKKYVGVKKSRAGRGTNTY
jgi:hypothetical protein